MHRHFFPGRSFPASSRRKRRHQNRARNRRRSGLRVKSLKAFIQNRWQSFSRTPFGCLLRLCITRMFHGGGELDLGIGVIVIMLAMPGILVSLLMFEKYGSLIRYLRGNPIFDPYTATMPDEYFFLVLSMTVTGAAALWRWDALFLDRRDHANLVPLPLSLRAIFFANLLAILALAALFTVVVNAASLILFPKI